MKMLPTGRLQGSGIVSEWRPEEGDWRGSQGLLDVCLYSHSAEQLLILYALEIYLQCCLSDELSCHL